MYAIRSYYGGFRHELQSLRVVERLEKEGRGLNLSWEVRNGIARHSKGQGEVLPKDTQMLPSTLEGCVVRVSDVIAYINHDLDDAIRAGVVSLAQVPKALRGTLGESHSQRIDVLRITSYNVCYTKLLRAVPPASKSRGNPILR